LPAYFAVIQNAPGVGPTIESQSHDAFNIAYQYSVDFSSEKLTKARIELAIKGMLRDIDRTWTNISILINQHAYECKDLLEKPVERLEYWLKKE
jgi:hypothetical protein